MTCWNRSEHLLDFAAAAAAVDWGQQKEVACLADLLAFAPVARALPSSAGSDHCCAARLIGDQSINQKDNQLINVIS